MRKRKVGRPAVWMTCGLCSRKFNHEDLRTHEPECRRKKLLKPGKRFHITISGKTVEVTLRRVDPEDGSLQVVDERNGRRLRVRSARALHEWMDQATLRFFRPKPPAEK